MLLTIGTTRDAVPSPRLDGVDNRLQPCANLHSRRSLHSRVLTIRSLHCTRTFILLALVLDPNVFTQPTGLCSTTCSRYALIALYSCTNPGHATANGKAMTATADFALDLPADIIVLIFDELEGDALSLSNFSRVCRTWHTLCLPSFLHDIDLSSHNLGSQP